MDWTAIAAIVVSAVTGGAVGAWAQARLHDAQATRELMAAVNESLVEPLRERVAELEAVLERREVQWRRERRALVEGIHALTCQLVDHDLVPVWELPRWFGEDEEEMRAHG